MIPYGKQEITQDDIDAVLAVLKSDYLTQGPNVPGFEHAVASKVSAKYAVAFNSATSALHSACLALDVGVGDLVWTSPITFVASANCALYCGADIDFVDINPSTFNMCADKLEEKLKSISEKKGRLPKVVIPVHMCGQSCDMKRIAELSEEYGFSVIEDASHAIGASYEKHMVGGCRYSDISIFSFHPVKIITTAEGGVATTSNATLAEKLSLFRSHGVTRDERLMAGESHGPWYYQQVALGYNYRMTELQAALGVSQIARLDDFINKRNDLAQRYYGLLKELPIHLPEVIEESRSSWHLFIIRLDLETLGKTKNLTHREIFVSLREKGIGVNLHYIPVHTQPYFQSLGFEVGQFPIAEAYYKQAISIPIYHHMSLEDQDYIANSLEEILL